MNGDQKQKHDMQTIRKQIIDLLKNEEWSAIDLSQELGIREKEVYEHLPHIDSSLKAQGKKLIIQPCKCVKCGYVFIERKRFTRPGKCPKCKATYILRPKFSIH